MPELTNMFLLFRARAARAACMLAFALALGSSACATRTVFRYEPSPRITGEPICNEGVAIYVLDDLRGRHAVNHNLKNLALIPFVPFATSYRDFPERTWFDDSQNLNGFDPARDLAAAFESEMDSQGLFNKYKNVESQAHAERYELRGILRDAHVSEGYITYGASFFSPLLHIAGLPEGTLRCAITAEISLVDRRDGSVVWQSKFDGRRTRATWIYSSKEAEHLCYMFSSLADEWVRPAVAELRKALALRAK
ncbi:MAG: hypothetical protein HY286_02345 [Planctomycetes bacterium]|nr:hypothetical protein [Planctomycetota bacterium]